MIKKFLLMVIVFGMSLISFSNEIDESQIANDYPYKDSAIKATVLGTPKEQQYTFSHPKGPKVRTIKATKKVPEILRQWSDFKYGVWKQKNDAPLMIIISGTGSLYNSGLSVYMANVFYDRGYNVIAFSSVTTMPFIVSQSKNNYAGYIKSESEQMYDIIRKAIADEKKDGMKINNNIYIGGYSLGGFQSLLIHKEDEKRHQLGIKKSLLLNTPISILTATSKLDKFLIKNGIFDASGVEKFFDTHFSKIIYNDMITSRDLNVTQDSTFTLLNKLALEDNDFEILTGLLFRLYSANMTFAGEVFSGSDAIGRLSNKKSYKRFDSVTKEFTEGLSISFDEYAKEILYPYLKKNKYPNMTLEDFYNDFDLRSNEDFINKHNNDIVFISSTDDILLSKEDLEYINQTFKNKVMIPHGGHTGVLWHKDVAKLMVDKLEEK